LILSFNYLFINKFFFKIIRKMRIAKTKRCHKYKQKAMQNHTCACQQTHVIQAMLDKHLFPIVMPFHVPQEANSNFVVVVSIVQKKDYYYKNKSTSTNLDIQKYNCTTTFILIFHKFISMFIFLFGHFVKKFMMS
jgi:hypothetical protein